MANYLSLFIQLEGASFSAKSLDRINSSGFFRLVAMGAIDAHNNGDNWFLGGYALEDFARHFLDHQVPKPASIRLAGEEGTAQRDYLQMVAEHLSQSKLFPQKLSPFEKANPSGGVTFIETHLDSDVQSDFAQWLTDFPEGVLYLYGSVNVSVQNPKEFPWQQAFRFLYPPEDQTSEIGAPFLVIRMNRSRFSKQTLELNIHSESTVWLAEGHALNGRVGRDEADVNLRALVGLAELLTSIEPTKNRSAELHLEGSIFNQESKRIRQAFTDML